MQPVHFGNPRRQRFQAQALHREQFARHGADMLLVSRVDLVAPLARLLVQIFPAGERTPCQKVVFDEGKRALHARRTIGIADLVRDKAESEAFRERLHLGHGNHFAPRAAQHHDVRVVDHHTLHHAAGMAQRIGEKYLAIKSLKGGINLEKQHARIAQHRRRRLRFVFSAAHFHRVR